MLIPNIMPILLENKLFVVKNSKYDLMFWRFCHRHGKREYSQLDNNIRKKSDTYFCSPLNGDSNGVWRSEKSFKTREEIGLQERWLILSSAYSCQDCLTQVFCFFVTQSYMIRLSFWWGIRIYQIRNITVNGKGQNLKFSQNDAIFLFSRCS